MMTGCSVSGVEGSSTPALERASFSVTHTGRCPTGDGSADMLDGNTPGRSSHSRFRPQPEETTRWHSVQNRRAARTVAGRAVDAQDCQSLLEMLGLAAADGKPQSPPLP
jgi:hypothetical protein